MGCGPSSFACGQWLDLNSVAGSGAAGVCAATAVSRSLIEGCRVTLRLSPTPRGHLCAQKSTAVSGLKNTRFGRLLESRPFPGRLCFGMPSSSASLSVIYALSASTFGAFSCFCRCWLLYTVISRAQRSQRLITGLRHKVTYHARSPQHVPLFRPSGRDTSSCSQQEQITSS